MRSQAPEAVARHRTWSSWYSMKARCLRKGKDNYRLYGGRGISFVDRWMDFENFIKDMGLRPEGRTLDRIDPNKGYYPENCRWATPKQQSRNRTNNNVITINGESRCLREWCDLAGITPPTYKRRKSLGDTDYEAFFSRPFLRRDESGAYFEFDGKTKSLKEWCEVAGINYHTAYHRILRGWHPKEAVFKPARPLKPRNLPTTAGEA
jgi:hypothetical protein